MIEDDIYRTSTQFRLWSFTESSLQSVRANTNAVASERVRCAIRRAREAREASGQTQAPGARATSTAPSSSAATPNPGEVGGDGGAGAGGGSFGGEEKEREREIDCLTTEEELELVRYYCEKTMELGDEYKPPLPTMVRATAIQYLRRFYLTNSPMTYHPKSIMPCALFLATKTDNYYLSLSSFAEQIPNSTPEDIIAPEFLLTQGLRFTFDVRHPFRGLEGGIMELLAIAEGNAHAGPHRQDIKTPAQFQKDLQALPLPTPGTTQVPSPTTRISKAHQTSREFLKSSAQMTDAYFLYTPSQIWLAALYLADKPLAEFYLECKIGLPPPKDNETASTSTNADPLSTLRTRILSTITSCSALLASYSPDSATNPSKMKNLKRIGKKLYHCQNPEKVDLVGLNRAQKRDGGVTATSASTAASSAAASGMTPGATQTQSQSQSQDGEVFEGAGGGRLGEAVEIPERAVKKRKVEGDGSGMFGGELRG